MDYFTDVVVLGGAFVVLLSFYNRKRRNKRRYWVHPYLSKRNETGRLHTAFKGLLSSPQLKKWNFPNGCNFVWSEIRLAIVLECLASGTISRHISSVYRISKSSFCQIIIQVCDIIVLELDSWIDVANEFNYRWNFSNCLGAIDAKHVPIVCPTNSGSLYFHYKKFYSIVLMAISDAKYTFLYVNVWKSRR